jgi:hypothetical protein
MLPRAQGSLTASIFDDPQCSIVLGSAVIPPNAKLLYLLLLELAGGFGRRVETKLAKLAEAIGRDRRTVLRGIRELADAALVAVAKMPPEGFSRPTDGFWSIDVGYPAEARDGLRRRTSTGQRSLPGVGDQDESPTPAKADRGARVPLAQRDKMVPFCPAGSPENALSVLREERSSIPVSPSEPSAPLGTLVLSGPLELSVVGARGEPGRTGAPAGGEPAKAAASEVESIGAVIGERVEAIEAGTHDAYYRAKRERRIQEILRRVNTLPIESPEGGPLKTIVAVKVASAEQSGLIDPAETDAVLTWMDEKRRSGDLPIPSQAFVGTIKNVFSRNKVDWPGAR